MRRRIVLVLTLAVITGFAAWLVMWSPFFDSPERHVARYLGATSSGDLSRAMSEWSMYEGSARIPPEPIAVRRRDVTNELAAARAGSSYSVTAIDYWRTCCEPGQGPHLVGRCEG